MSKALLPAGTRFSRLVTTGLSRLDATLSNRVYESLCDCGEVRWVQRGNLVGGTTKSCGCLRTEVLKLSKRKHKSPPAINEEIEHYKYSARKRHLNWDLTQEEAATLLKLPCTYCGIGPLRLATSKFGETEVVSGIDRVDSTSGYNLQNCVSCCSTCNYAKRDLSTVDWKGWIQRLIAFNQRP